MEKFSCLSHNQVFPSGVGMCAVLLSPFPFISACTFQLSNLAFQFLKVLFYASIEGFTFFVTLFYNKTVPEHLTLVLWLD